MSPDPLQALSHLEAWIVRCGRCPEDVQHSIDMIRAGLRERLAEPEDPLEDAADALQRAEAALRGYHGRHGEAILHEIISAAVSVGRARALRG